MLPHCQVSASHKWKGGTLFSICWSQTEWCHIVQYLLVTDRMVPHCSVSVGHRQNGATLFSICWSQTEWCHIVEYLPVTETNRKAPQSLSTCKSQTEGCHIIKYVLITDKNVKHHSVFAMLWRKGAESVMLWNLQHLSISVTKRKLPCCPESG